MSLLRPKYEGAALSAPKVCGKKAVACVPPDGEKRPRAERLLAMHFCRMGLWIGVVLAAGLTAVPSMVMAQISNWPAWHTYVYKMQPDVRIPLAPLGYGPPGELPAFSFYSLVSLHFVDSKRLLFSFHTTGLMTRKETCEPENSERLVRTVVLDLPSGKVEKRADWQLDDYAQYLWSLNNGQFLFRRCSQLSVLDARLEPTPLIDVPDPIHLLNQSPDRSLVLIEHKKDLETQGSAGTGASVLTGMPEFLHPSQLQDMTVDFIRLNPLRVLARSHTQKALDLPVLAEGFLEVLDQTHNQWLVNLQPFHGEMRRVGLIRSTCVPQLVALTDDTFLAIVCKDQNQTSLLYQAYDLYGKMLWQQPMDANRISPQFAYSENLSRLAIGTLHTTHQMAALDPLNAQDIDGQIIDVYNVQTGRLLLSFRTTPVYTAAQNFALSPDGDRLAVLHDDAIEIYDLNHLPQGPPPGLR